CRAGGEGAAWDRPGPRRKQPEALATAAELPERTRAITPERFVSFRALRRRRRTPDPVARDAAGGRHARLGQVFNFPRPETLAREIAPLINAVADASGAVSDAPGAVSVTLRGRLRHIPPLTEAEERPWRLWKAQGRAVRSLEASLARAHPRALIQMATGA